MVNNLTTKQQETLDIIESYVSSHGSSPTLSELQVLLDVSSNQAVLNHLDALEEKGFIERTKTARGIRLVKSNEEPMREDSQSMEFLDLLTGLAEKKKQKKAKPARYVGYADPYSMDNSSGKIISGHFNNEQY